MEEVGRFQPGPELETGTITQQGSYEFIGDDGNTYRMEYVADQNGFQPQANYLPVAPAQIPEYAQLRAEYPQLFWAEGLASGRQTDNFGTTTTFESSFDNRGNRFSR